MFTGSMLVATGGSADITISSDVNNVDIRALALANGWDGVARIDLTVTIAQGVYIGSTSTATASLVDGAAFPTGSTIRIVNKGNVYGKGGNGGSGDSGVGTPGGAGGTAVKITNNNVSINNALGVIAGGGGGGGAGAGSIGDKWVPGWTGAGGGGGQGITDSSGGTGGSNGTGGTRFSAGSGGLVGGYAGGNGGILGAAGSGTYGGAAGKAVEGNSKITWLATGTRTGVVA